MEGGKKVKMPAQSPLASPLFLRESEVRRGMELLYFGYSQLTRSADEMLAQQGLGRAHHRALYFIARQPDLTVTQLLSLLSITKQSLGRVLNELGERGLIETDKGTSDGEVFASATGASGCSAYPTTAGRSNRRYSIRSAASWPKRIKARGKMPSAASGRCSKR